MKSLRSTGSRVACARLAEKFRRALKRRRVGQHRETGRAALLIGARERGRIEIGADQALGRARLLDLRDQAVAFAARALLPARRESRAAARRPRARASSSASGSARLRGGDFLALVGGDVVENGHAAAFDTAISCSSLRLRRAAVDAPAPPARTPSRQIVAPCRRRSAPPPN